MCGIIGKAGVDNVTPDLIRGLKNLEYRGYDSSGIAVFNKGKLCRKRAKGKIEELAKVVDENSFFGNAGIGHTRWATHGRPSVENAHPHKSPKGKFMVVHNGIIENAEEIKKHLLPENDVFYSDTDTEVICHLLEKYYKGDVIGAIANACAVLKGSYALAILCEEWEGTVFGAASGSPLAVAKCSDSCYIVSDVNALEEKTDDVYRVGNGEICRVDSDTISFFDPSGKEMEKRREKIFSNEEDTSKCEYEHFMLKEIYEQPEAVENTLDSLISLGEVDLPHVMLDGDFIREQMEKIVLVGCGSAYHTAMVGKRVIERLCSIPCQVEIASEYRYSEPLTDKKTLAVFISQSGETADTLASLRLAKWCKAQVISIVNVRGSAIAGESENVIFTKAGREVSVATTKAYSAQLASLYALGIFIGRHRGDINDDDNEFLINELLKLPEKIRQTIEKNNDRMEQLSRALIDKDDIFFIGRLSDFATASEGALKMKEISYKNCQAYPSGELKHGTISLVGEGTPVIAIAGDGRVFSKTMSNISECVARGGEAIVITEESKKLLVKSCAETITVPDTAREFRSSLLVIPLQLLAYHTAKNCGCDIDRPKNLAKSVTVE